jgi:hypothetical protein
MLRRHPQVGDRYRVTLTLASGALLTYETFDEAHLRAWIVHEEGRHRINGRLIERIATLVIDTLSAEE